MNIISVSKSVIFTLLSFCVTSVQGSETSKLKIPNTFTKNEVISASDMNENFDTIATKVNSLKDSLRSLNDSLEVRSQFVGFSATGVDGGGGIFEMQRVCADKDAKSHVCNTSEIMQSTYDSAVIDALPAQREAWVLIDVSNTIGLDDSSSPKLKLSCNGWTSDTTAYFGLTVTNKGKFKHTTSCDFQLRVACCK